MALIKCPECGKEISDKATSCPSCGHPINKINTDNKKFEVELTNKKWKTFGLIGLVSFFLGLFAYINKLNSLGTFFSFLGLIIILFSRFGRWWNNG